VRSLRQKSRRGSYCEENALQRAEAPCRRNTLETLSRRQTCRDDRTTRRTVAAQETYVFGASVVNSLRFGLNREGVLDNLTAQALNPAVADLSIG
jgi:hypothetical protein